MKRPFSQISDSLGETETTDETQIAKVKAIATVNQEIIGQIESKKDSQVITFEYHITNGLENQIRQFHVQEAKQTKAGQAVLDEWKKVLELKWPIDLFNDKLDYKCESFGDIKRLNSEMTRVVEKYSFLDPKRAHPELEKFKNNFELLQTSLGELEGMFQEPESKLEELKKDLEEINQKIVSVVHKQGVVIGPSPNLDWWDQSDKLGGIRQSTHDPCVFFLVSKSNQWDKTKVYDPPDGYHWMTSDEGKAIFQGTGNNTQYVYYKQGGWSNYTWNGLDREFFIFSDSSTTNLFKHAGHYDHYPPQQGINESKFAGIVCLKL